MNEFSKENIQKVNISDLLFNDWNPKDNEKQYLKVKQSLEVHGLMTLVFVRETDEGLEVVDGNSRVRAAKELGYSEIYVYNLGKISEAEAKQLVLYFQVQVPFVFDMLAPLAMELDTAGMELPFNEKEMEKFRELEAFNMDTAFKDEEPIPEEEQEEIVEKLKTYKIKLEPEDFDLIRNAIDKVVMSETVNEGRALELLLMAGSNIVESES